MILTDSLILMENIMFGLEGKKTYITGIITIVGAIAGILTNSVPLPDGIQLVITAVMGMTIRSGISSSE